MVKATGVLTVVGTPVGNLQDMAPRAAEALRVADVLACEDTRRAGQLLKLMGLPAVKLVSYHKDNEQGRVDELVRNLRDGLNVALISDGGMPGISDPGAVLVAAARAGGFRVDVGPGPSAASIAVAGSGFFGGYVFAGFLPRKGRERKEMLARLADSPETVVLYEAPLRVAETLEDIHNVFGNRPAWLARELTKLHEEWLGPDVAGILAALAVRDGVKGECVLVVKGRDVLAPVAQEPADFDVELKARLAAGEPVKKLAAWLAAQAHIKASDAYTHILALKR